MSLQTSIEQTSNGRRVYLMHEVMSKLKIKNRRTLYKYVKNGMFRRYELNPYVVRYDAEDVDNLIGGGMDNQAVKYNRVVIYARVRTKYMMAELEDQIRRVTAYANGNGYAVSEVYMDTCSSFNWSKQKRTGFHRMVVEIYKSNIGTVIIESPDRLSRFDYGLFVAMCKYARVGVIFLHNDPVNDNYKDELATDLKTMVTNVQRLYGKNMVRASNDPFINKEFKA